MSREVVRSSCHKDVEILKLLSYPRDSKLDVLDHGELGLTQVMEGPIVTCKHALELLVQCFHLVLW